MVVITISGPPGAGSSTTARLLAEKLGLLHYSTGRVFKDIAQGKVRQAYYYAFLKELCDARGLVIPVMSGSDDSSAAHSFWDTELGKSEELHNILDELANKLADKGDVVIDGKLSLKLVKNADLRVWLKCALKERARRSAERDGISVSKASVLVSEREKKERDEWINIYGFDYFRQEGIADLVIDTTRTPPERIVEKIVSRLKI